MTGRGRSGACRTARRSEPARRSRDRAFRTRPYPPTPNGAGPSFPRKQGMVSGRVRRNPLPRRRGRVGVGASSTVAMALLNDVITYLEMREQPTTPRLPAHLEIGD